VTRQKHYRTSSHCSRIEQAKLLLRDSWSYCIWLQSWKMYCDIHVRS